MTGTLQLLPSSLKLIGRCKVSRLPFIYPQLIGCASSYSVEAAVEVLG